VEKNFLVNFTWDQIAYQLKAGCLQTRHKHACMLCPQVRHSRSVTIPLNRYVQYIVYVTHLLTRFICLSLHRLAHLLPQRPARQHVSPEWLKWTCHHCSQSCSHSCLWWQYHTLRYFVPVTLTVIYELDLTIAKTHLHTKMNFLHQGFKNYHIIEGQT